MPLQPIDPAGPGKLLFQQFRRYVMAGGLAFAVDYALLYLLAGVAGFHYLAAATIAFGAGMITSYVLCVSWIFHHRRLADRRQEFLVFGIIGVAGLLLTTATMLVLTGHAGMHYLLSKLVAAAVTLLFNFILRRGILFSERRASP